MKTPICDFVKNYSESKSMRLHMPGHKGERFLGMENMDITEIEGADSLYEADGIIRQSEANASALFGCPTFFSAEGSSQCIRAMVYLAVMYANGSGRKPIIAAGRNAHKTFMSAVALTGAEVVWLYGENGGSYLSCDIQADYLDKFLSDEKPVAVYLTSPDYLGNTSDIKSLAEVCHRHGALLLVDNAHGAYLRFLSPSAHPIDLGADICCDSAHKTLPVLTGGAYLHISPRCDSMMTDTAKSALVMFGSTSPSYLIMQSLDMANKYLETYREELSRFIPHVERFKSVLINHGYTICGSEPLKVTISAKQYGYTGRQLADILLEKNIVCEFSDPDFLVMMFTPQVTLESMEKLADTMISIPKKQANLPLPPKYTAAKKAMDIRSAMFSPREVKPIRDAVGRVLADANVGCPPAVPILVCGETIDENAVNCFEYYGIERCAVVKTGLY